MPDLHEEDVQEAIGTGVTLSILTTGGWINVFYTDIKKASIDYGHIIHALHHPRTDRYLFGEYLIRLDSIIGTKQKDFNKGLISE